MKSQRWCGLTAKMGTVLSGVFTIIATHMYLIFEQKQLRNDNCFEINPPEEKVNDTLRQFIVCWSFHIVLTASTVTLLVSSFLLYSVYAQHYRGLLLYVVWILAYEVINLVVQIFTNELSIGEVRVMRWLGFVLRTLLHCYGIFYVIICAHIIYKSQNQSNIVFYNRRISTSSGEAHQQKSKILNFAPNYKE